MVLAYYPQRTGRLFSSNTNYPPQGIISIIPVVQQFLLDQFPNAAVAYSLRQLRTAYTGPAIRVEETDTNTTKDIGFLANGLLNVVDLLSFVGSADGLVKIIYDQSGNGVDLDAQTVDTFFPLIIIGGVLQTSNSSPSIFFDGINDNLFSTINTFLISIESLFAFGVWQKLDLLDNPTNFNLRSGTNPPERVTGRAPLSSGEIQWNAGNETFERLETTQGTFNDLLQHVYVFIKNLGTSNKSIRRDAVELAQTTAISTTSVRKVCIGANGPSGVDAANMQWQEFVYYATDVTNDVSGIESNIKSFYTEFLIKVVYPTQSDLSYDHYKFYQVSPNKVQGTHTDFPILIEDTLGANKLLSTGGIDIRVFGSTELTPDVFDVPLAYERELTDESTGKIVLHVKMPTLSNSKLNENSVQLVYGKASDTDGQTPDLVWASQYQAVYLMNQTTFGSTDTKDSTSRNQDSILVLNDENLSSVSGQVNGAVNFSASESQIDLPATLDANISNIVSVLAWVQANSTGLFNTIFTNIINVTKVKFQLGLSILGAGNIMEFGFFDNGWKIISDPNPITVGQKIMYVGTIENNQLKLYRDGVLVASANVGSNMPTDNGLNFRIGHRHDGTQHWNGIIDNILVTNNVISSDFISTYYNATVDNNSFWSRTPELNKGETVVLADDQGRLLQVKT